MFCRIQVEISFDVVCFRDFRNSEYFPQLPMRWGGLWVGRTGIENMAFFELRT
jgi:hypothetical protein